MQAVFRIVECFAKAPLPMSSCTTWKNCPLNLSGSAKPFMTYLAANGDEFNMQTGTGIFSSTE